MDNASETSIKSSHDTTSRQSSGCLSINRRAFKHLQGADSLSNVRARWPARHDRHSPRHLSKASTRALIIPSSSATFSIVELVDETERYDATAIKIWSKQANVNCVNVGSSNNQAKSVQRCTQNTYKPTCNQAFS